MCNSQKNTSQYIQFKFFKLMRRKEKKVKKQNRKILVSQNNKS